MSNGEKRMEHEETRALRFWAGWVMAFVIGSTLVILASLPPFLEIGPRLLLHHGFSWACHQMPERSFFVDGVQLAVCHRCYGAYWGLVLGVVGFLGLCRWDAVLNSNARYFILGALLIPGIDWAGGVLGVWANTPVTRVVTGALFGIAAGYFLARAFIKAIDRAGASSQYGWTGSQPSNA